MNLAKGKICYPLLIKSTYTIYDANVIIKSYNGLRNPLILLDLVLGSNRLNCGEVSLNSKCPKSP